MKRAFTTLVVLILSWQVSQAFWHGNVTLVASPPPVLAGVTASPSMNFTVTRSGGNFNGVQTVTVSDGAQGGTITPSVGSPGTSTVTVTPTNGTGSFTFTYNAASTGNKTLSFANGQGWANPSPLIYYANTAANWFGETWNNPGGAPVLTGLTHSSYHSNIMNQDIGFNIYLPPGYGSGSAHYPVVYFFHGTPSDENTEPPIVQPYLQAKMVAGSVQPMIYVFPKTGWHLMDAVSGAPAYGAYMAESTLIYELIPYIDANYRTIANPAARAIQGFSMGGQGCERISLKFPQLFASFYCFAPAIDDTSANIASNEPGGYTNMLNSIASNYDPMSVWGLYTSNLTGILARNLPMHVTIGSADSLESYSVTLFSDLDTVGISHEPLTSATSCGHDLSCDATFVGGANVDFASDHFPAPPSRSQQFVNAVGINVHIGYTSTPYNTLSNITTDLTYLGVTTTRDVYPYSGIANASYYTSLAAAGIRWLWNFSGGSVCSNAPAGYFSDIMPKADTMVTSYPGSLIYIEGWNEINNFPVCYNNTATTNSTTASGNPTLHFASTMASIQAAYLAGQQAGVVLSDLTTPASITGGTTVSATASTTVTMSANAAGTVGSGDNIQFQANSNTASGITWQQDIFNTVHADSHMAGVQVVNFTDFPVAGVTGSADLNNFHYYECCGIQPYWSFNNPAGGSNGTQFINSIVIAGLPMMLTETGFYTLPDGATGVDNATQARYTINQIFDAYRVGVQGIYIYELIDEGATANAQNRFGLFDNSNNPKPAATALKNLLGILKDTGGTALTFTPVRLNYYVSGLPLQESGNAGGFTELLEKSNGTYELSIRPEQTIWDASTNTDVTPPTVTAKVNLGITATTVNVYDPITGSSPINTYSGVSSISVALAADPLIVEVVP